HADALADDASGERALAQAITTLAAFLVAGELAHNDDCASGDVGVRRAIAAWSHAMLFECDGAFHAAVNVKRFATGDFAFDHQGASDGGLFDRRRYGLDRRGRVQG